MRHDTPERHLSSLRIRAYQLHEGASTRRFRCKVRQAGSRNDQNSDDCMILDVSIPAALFAGLVSFLSPCVLPLVPPYLI
jgi:hypothetical protein